jgi:hypothetical protein
MTMPEAPLHEHNSSKSREYEIGPSGKLGHMQPEPKPCRVHCGSNTNLRFRVATANSCHHPGARSPIYYVYQVVIPTPALHPWAQSQASTVI